MKRVPCIPCGAIGKAGGAAADVDDVASDADNCRRELEIGQIAVPRFPRSEAALLSLTARQNHPQMNVHM